MGADGSRPLWNLNPLDTVSNTSHGHPFFLSLLFSPFLLFSLIPFRQDKLGLSTTTTSSPWYVSSASIDIEVQREIFRTNVKRDGWKMAVEFQSWSHGHKKDEQENDWRWFLLTKNQLPRDIFHLPDFTMICMINKRYLIRGIVMMVQWCSVSGKIKQPMLIWDSLFWFPVDQIGPQWVDFCGKSTASDVRCEAVECHY